MYLVLMLHLSLSSVLRRSYNSITAVRVNPAFCPYTQEETCLVIGGVNEKRSDLSFVALQDLDELDVLRIVELGPAAAGAAGRAPRSTCGKREHSHLLQLAGTLRKVTKSVFLKHTAFLARMLECRRKRVSSVSSLLSAGPQDLPAPPSFAPLVLLPQ